MTDNNEGTAITVQITPVQPFVEIQQSMIRAVATFGQKVYDVATAEGLAVAKADAADIDGYLKRLEACRVEIKREPLETCRLIDAEAKRISGPASAMLAPLKAMIKDEEGKAARIEAERKQAITARIEAMNRRPPWGATSGEIKSMLEKVEAVVIDDLFCEFQDDAAVAKMTAVKELREMHAVAVANETARAELAARQKAEAEAPKINQAAVEEFISECTEGAPRQAIVETVAGMIMSECIAEIATPAVALLRIAEIVDEYPWSFDINDDDLAQIHLIGRLAKAGLK